MSDLAPTHEGCDTWTDEFDPLADARVVTWPCGLKVELYGAVPPRLWLEQARNMHDSYYAPRVPMSSVVKPTEPQNG